MTYLVFTLEKKSIFQITVIDFVIISEILKNTIRIYNGALHIIYCIFIAYIR